MTNEETCQWPLRHHWNPDDGYRTRVDTGLRGVCGHTRKQHDPYDEQLPICAECDNEHSYADMHHEFNANPVVASAITASTGEVRP